MAKKAEKILTPVGRLVRGSLYVPQTTDADGKPLVVKSGPNAGSPKVQYFFAVAIPKGGEGHWNQTEWGSVIHKVGVGFFPQADKTPIFAWKILDGDSSIPNRMGVAPNAREGYSGSWVVTFSSGFAPKICSSDGSRSLDEPGLVKLGHYVQVYGSVAGNNSLQQPGVYINFDYVAHAGFGEEISGGLNVEEIGFGKAALPKGASRSPIAQLNESFLVPAIPVPPVVTPPVRRMTALAGGATYEQCIGKGWTDALLIQHGLMTN